MFQEYINIEHYAVLSKIFNYPLRYVFELVSIYTCLGVLLGNAFLLRPLK